MKSICAIMLGACAGAPQALDLATARWRELATGSQASLRGLAPLDRNTCWCTGSGGTVLRTRDGGRNWQRLTVPGAAGLDLRAVVAFSADVALVANAGSPARIFRTEDGGESWRMVHEDTRPQIFLDAMVSGAMDCWCIGDPLDGAFVLLQSADGGRSWQPAAGAMPAPGAGEAAFAASNSCLCARGGSLWLVTGGGACRCIRSRDGGRSFTAVPLPLPGGGESAGAFSVAFADEEHGVAVGGDYRQPESNEGTAAWTEDGGSSWHRSDTGALGYRSAVAFVPGGGCVAAGERGCSWSADGGRTWRALVGPGFHAVAAANDGSVWAAGGGGRAAVLSAPSGPP